MCIIKNTLLVKKRSILILTLLLCSAAHAEVSDKLSSLPELFVLYTAISLINFVCLIKKSKLSYIVLPLTCIYAYICMTDDFGKEGFDLAISAEMGEYYAYFRWYGLAGLLVFSTLIAWLWMKIGKKSH